MSQQGRTFAVLHVTPRHAVQLRLCHGDNSVIAERLYGLLTVHRREAKPNRLRTESHLPSHLSRRDNTFIDFTNPASAELSR